MLSLILKHWSFFDQCLISRILSVIFCMLLLNLLFSVFLPTMKFPSQTGFSPAILRALLGARDGSFRVQIAVNLSMDFNLPRSAFLRKKWRNRLTFLWILDIRIAANVALP